MVLNPPLICGSDSVSLAFSFQKQRAPPPKGDEARHTPINAQDQPKLTSTTRPLR